MRIWFSGPRILGGLVRPGISFALSELRRRERRKPVYSPAPAQDPDIPFKKMPLHIRLITWAIMAFAVWGFISMVGCTVMMAHA